MNMNMNMNIDDNKAGNIHHNSTARRSLRIRNLSTRPSYAEVEEGIDDDDDDDAESIANGNANATDNDVDDDVDSSEFRHQRPHPQVHRRSKRARIDAGDGDDNGDDDSGDDASFSTEMEMEMEMKVDMNTADSEVDTQRTTEHTNTNMNTTKIDIEMEMEMANFKMPIDDLCGGVIQNIYSYLDDSRDLYNFSQCSKWLSSLVKYEHVVQVAIFENKKSYQYKKIIDRVEHALDKNSIYVPPYTDCYVLSMESGVREVSSSSLL
eukprot:CAMPEP_0204619924 /NCGR_PEP_ID=MMETSP0717-20131115/6126_1 /ASSEMBLY_ACC=CAM_ASM_000666 /TAXON_ID=230516 /ORGANISM="Chaetoceros curvisetus" /LENGTH=264 /DNA_ID=CAMNT_0051634001 /DNA_START=1 /DNA_END=796 /DNA_ORIENTATION=+